MNDSLACCSGLRQQPLMASCFSLNCTQPYSS